MKLFVGLFAVIFGLASCLTVKEELSQRMEVISLKLVSAMVHAYNHGQDFHRTVYEGLFREVKVKQRYLETLSDNVTLEEISGEADKLIALEIQVFQRLRDVDLHEIAKTKAIYLAAIKEVTNYNLRFPAGQHLTDVIKIVEMEGFMRENPKVTVDPNMRQNTIRYSLELEYANLHRTMTNWTVGSFDDYYNLANRTRETATKYRQRSMIAEAEKAELLVRQFDQLTMALAREWPIDSIQSVEYYFSLCKLHYQLHVELETLKPLEKTIKEKLLEDVENQEKIVKNAMEKFRQRYFYYFVERLDLTLTEVKNVRLNVERLPANADRKQAFLMIGEVENLQKVVEVVVKNPAPEESLKAQGLYLAAMKSAHQDADNSPVTSGQLVEQVIKIATKEQSLTNKNQSLAEKLQITSANPEVRSMYQKLKNMLDGHKILTPEDDLNLELKADKKLAELKLKKNTEKATEMEISVVAFARRTIMLNKWLPIDSKVKADSWFMNAKVHYEYFKILEGFLKEN